MRPDVYEYVKDYFQKNFIEYYLIFDEEGLPYAKWNYLGMFLNDICKEYDELGIKSGKYDKELKGKLNDYVNKYFTKKQRRDCLVLYNYVKMIMAKRGVSSSYGDDMHDHVIKTVVSRVWPQYSEDRLNTKEFNHVIVLTHINVHKRMVMMIDKKIEQLLDYSFDVFKFKNMGINKEDLKQYVETKIFLNEKREFLTRLKSLVLDPNRELSRTGVDTNKYVKEYIAKKTSGKNVESDTSRKEDNVKITEKVENIKQSNILEAVSSVSEMRDKSVQKEGLPKEIRFIKNVKELALPVVTLALVGSLIGGIGVRAIINHNNDTYAIARVDAIDGFDYDVSYKSDSYYYALSNHIISFYSKLGEIDDESYKLLGFYHAFEEINDTYGERLYPKLNKMNEILKMVKDRLVEENSELNLRNIVHADDNKGVYCFLDLVYEFLAKMGYTKVNTKPYQTALRAYKMAEYSNVYGVAVDNPTEEELEIIKDVLEKYLEYSKKNKLELGYLIENGNYSFFPSYPSDGRGK